MARQHPQKDWAGLKSAYRRGEGSLIELAPKFGIAHSTAEKRSAREKWRIQRQEVGRKAEERAAERDIESVASMISKHRRGAALVQDLALELLSKKRSKLSADQLDILSRTFARMVPLERLSAGLERQKPVEVLPDGDGEEVVVEIDAEDDQVEDGKPRAVGAPG